MTLWFLARATGMVAVVAFSIAVALGALASRSGSVGASRTGQAEQRFLQQMAHRSAAVIGLGMIAAHVVLLIADSYVTITIPGVLVPFTSGYDGFALGLGTVAVYAFIVVAISGAVRGRVAVSDAATRRWRTVHLAAYFGWILAMGHGLLAGTDTGTWWAAVTYAVCALGVGAAVIARIVAADHHERDGLTLARRGHDRVLISGGSR